MSDVDEGISSINDYILGEGDAGEKEESDQAPVGNPTPPPDVDLDKLRGDRIGDTVYSGKWCIQTVMKLMQSNVVAKAESSEEAEDKAEVVDMEEELQNEVGSLWDMTSNVEVCQYLHSIGAIESICYVITSSRCPRATEMCVGMLANIITHRELWEILRNDSTIFKLLIQLLTNTDQPVLLEVTRFFNTALCHPDNAPCYSCLCENGQLVTQELMRILSASTNSDLLRQAAELAYNLMSLDEKDVYFCAFFADPDFVTATVEASKELGYEHETSGQNYLMEVFHYFTTYEAGALAIENGMNQIAETCTAYLKYLCQSINLSNNSSIITNIIATLNHIFCRHVIVRVGLMSSPSFIHCVLKTLVAVYRKLGCYNTIAFPKGRSSGQAKKSSSSWKQEELTPPETKPSASWSERALVTTSSSSAFRTPEASPRQLQKARELEVSWSERRISSPLAEHDFAEEKWKRPKQRKILKKKVRTVDVTSSNNDDEDAEGSRAPDEDGDDAQRPASRDDEDRVSGSTPADSSTAAGEVDQEKEDAGNADTTAMRIRHGDRFDRDQEVRKSGGFSPQRQFEEMDTEGIGEGDRNANCSSSSGTADKAEAKEGEERISSSRKSSDSADVPASGEETDHGQDRHNTSAGDGDQEEKPSSSTDVRTQGQSDEENYNNDGDDDDDDDDDGEEEFDESEDSLNVSNGDGVNGDRCHKLLAAITEFLTDYFNNMRESIAAEDGTPCISEVMTYFNTQCSSPELRAIVKCVGTSKDIKEPLGRLLHLCDHFQASHLKSVLLDFVKRNTGA